MCQNRNQTIQCGWAERRGAPQQHRDVLWSDAAFPREGEILLSRRHQRSLRDISVYVKPFVFVFHKTLVEWFKKYHCQHLFKSAVFFSVGSLSTITQWFICACWLAAGVGKPFSQHVAAALNARWLLWIKQTNVLQLCLLYMTFQCRSRYRLLFSSHANIGSILYYLKKINIIW